MLWYNVRSIYLPVNKIVSFAISITKTAKCRSNRPASHHCIGNTNVSVNQLHSATPSGATIVFTASVTHSILSMTSLIEETINCFKEELLENIKRRNTIIGSDP